MKAEGKISARVAAMVATLISGAAAAFTGSDPNRPRRGYHKRGSIGSGYTKKLLAKQATARLERFGLDVTVGAGRDAEGNEIRIPDPENRRLLRNARKRERQIGRAA